MNIEWKTSNNPVSYQDSVNFMENRIAKIYNQELPEMIWLLEHPSIYTAGSSASHEDLVDNNRIPVLQTGRGGKHTYHGPGQRIIYLMLDLRKRGNDLHKYIDNIENWLIATFAEIGIKGEKRKDRIGIWTINKNNEEVKIAAIGIRVRKWISYHGVAINVAPNLNFYKGIIPCGIKEYGVTSLKELGKLVDYSYLDNILKRKFNDFF